MVKTPVPGGICCYNEGCIFNYMKFKTDFLENHQKGECPVPVRAAGQKERGCSPLPQNFFPWLCQYVVASSPQHGENAAFLSSFPLGGIHSQGILPVIPLELQGIRHNHFLWHSLSRASVRVDGCFVLAIY